MTGTSYTSYTENGKKYFSFCSVSGNIDPNRKWLKVTETKRTKTNETENAGLQTHLLYYNAVGGNEQLTGKWTANSTETVKPKGTTTLSRKMMVSTLPQMQALAKIEKEKESKRQALLAAVKNQTGHGSNQGYGCICTTSGTAAAFYILLRPGREENSRTRRDR